MKKKTLLLPIAILLALSLQAQVIINNLAIPYTQDFNTLASSGTTNTTLPLGWAFLETGSGSNTTYAADNGSTNSGNTYSYGSTGNTERALGGLQSGTVVPTIGVQFNNNSGSTITSITINYTGEQWRLGALGRTDRLDFQYSLDATSLSSGIWTDENNLDFTAPVTSGTLGALDGNAAANKTVIAAFTITGLSIPSGSNFWLRWNDLNATGADDGLGVDDFTISYNGSVSPTCTEPTAQPTLLNLTPTPTTISGNFTAAVPAADEYLVIVSTSSTLSALPLDGITYAMGASLGGGIVTGTGTSTTFSASGLTPNTTYYFFVFALNNDACSGGANYLTANALQNNATTLSLPPCTTPSAAPTNLILTPSNISVSGSFTAAAGANRYLVIRSLSSSLSASPVNGTTYTAGQSFAGGTVVSYSSLTTFSAFGLNPATLYYCFVFSASGDCNGEPFYFGTSLSGNTTTLSGSGIPPGYYDAAAGLTCAPLKTALFGIISSGTTQLTYTPGVWNAYQTTDQHQNDNNTATIIWDIYSDNPSGPEPYTYTYSVNQCGTYNSEGDCYNREHSFPQAWFGSGQYPMYSDIHHLFPVDGKVNGERSNYPYGEVSAPSWTSMNGSKLGPNTYPGFVGTVFEPINAYKGDLSRAQLYMVTRYQNLVAGWQNNGNANDILNGTTYPALDNWDIKLMFKWHLQDPVSQKEIDRNNAIYALQGNRNPFIDHPEYVALVWQCTGLLPVTITDFYAQKNNESVLLKWYATYETNFKLFEIERSDNGTVFYKTGQVIGRNLANYSFTDNNLPAKDIIYYRLKMINIDGEFSYSKTIALRINNNFSGISIYPNPSAGDITIKLQHGLPQSSSLTITDIAGRIVWQQTLTGGLQLIPIAASKLNTGRYFMRISNDVEQLNTSFMVIK